MERRFLIPLRFIRNDIGLRAKVMVTGRRRHPVTITTSKMKRVIPNAVRNLLFY
jgi:hypothetical protein